MAAQQPAHAVGRRKTSVARVILRPGDGRWSINGRTLDDYFPRPAHRGRIEEPLQASASEGIFDIQVRVNGGGLTGQADAIRLGLARALALQAADKRVTLRETGMLTRDARKVERKK
ncbi:MAG: 30S ribosomal protein S9, partial [Gemmatimonadetes bacterium]|nr:30S ribosomal protein S9 [Gemmatimonadota bacterium]